MRHAVAQAWVSRWDAQQERYVADREERFTVLCDVVETALADVPEPVVLDLGCGPGSLAARLKRRLPHARVVGIDADPLLLGLARAYYGDAIDWVDADLTSADWQRKVPRTVHAAVSTTALHWLPEAGLARLYRTLADLMAPNGGVFVNADHIGNGDERVDSLIRTIRERRATRAGVTGNEEWRPWWDAILADPNFTDLVRDRAERTGDHVGNSLSVTGHSGLLRDAGFASVAPVWQIGDDHVLVALR